MEQSGRPRRYVIKDFVLDIERGTLTRGGADVPLRPKSFAVLQYLVEHAGQLVTRDELIEAVWGHPHVTDSSLNQCLHDVRVALDDHEQDLVHTVPRRGYRFDLPADKETPERRSEPAAPRRTRHARRNGLIALLIVAVVVLGFWAFHDGDWLVDDSDAPTTIAVLPLLDLSAERNLGYLADGLAEEILNALAQSRDLRVIARSSSFAFRGESAELGTIAEQLGADIVLEGSVRRSGEQLRVTAQLIETETSSHVWSQTYDYTLDDLFALQTAVARDVSDSLHARLELGAPSDPVDPGPDAYEAYLLGVHYLRQGDLDGLRQARDHLQEATRLAPDFAPAWSKLSDAYRRLAHRGGDAFRPLLDAYLEAAGRALELDPGLPEAHYLRAMRMRYERRFPEFQNALVRGLAQEPADPNFLLLAAGDATDYLQFEAAIELSERALRLDPLSSITRFNYASALISAGRLEDALAQYVRLEELYPGVEDWRYGRGLALVLLGRGQEAFDIANGLEDPRQHEQLLSLAYWTLGDRERARSILANLSNPDDFDALSFQVKWYTFTGQLEAAFDTLKRLTDRVMPGCDNSPPSEACVKLGQLWVSPLLGELRKWPPVREWSEREYPDYAARVESRRALYEKWLSQ